MTSSDSVFIEMAHPPATNNIPELYSDPLCSSSSSSDSNRQTNVKDSNVKLPYPVLADHRDPSSVLILLQKETQTTSKKILDVTRQIELCEQRLTSDRLSENEKKTLKYQRVKSKQQLDALKKHERRVNLQIDFITTKTEIKGLEDEQKQTQTDSSSEQNQQIKILLGKLKQKLDKMKIYMRTRNEQMKKLSQNKSKNPPNNDLRRASSTSSTSSQKAMRVNSSSTSTSNKEINRKRPVNSNAPVHPSKRLKPSSTHPKVPVIRLASRLTSHDHKSHSTRTPIVRFINKTTDSTINSASPTTPASSSSTLSPPMIGTNNSVTHGLTNNEISTMHNDDDDDDDEEDLDLDLDMEELFADDDDEHQTKKMKHDRNSHRQIQSNGSEKNSEKKTHV